MQKGRSVLSIILSLILIFSFSGCFNKQKEQVDRTNNSTVVQKQEEQEKSEQRIEKIVYITPTGKRYHFKKSCAGKNAKETTLLEASKKYSGCKKCTK